MTAITQNLPSFVKDLGVSIVGKTCYTSLVENLAFSDTACLKHALSKGLGVGIVVGGSIMKIPQIIIVLKSGSAEGLSLSAYILETLAYGITLAYSLQSGFPFTTYGENLFLAIQNVFIIMLIIHYKNPAQSDIDLTIAIVGMAAVGALLDFLPNSVRSLLMYTTLPLSLASKIPQILQNRRVKSTGNLSVVAVLAQIFGCVARLFTTAQETGDVLVGAGFFLALLLNVFLGVQVLSYWPTAKVAEKQQHSRPTLAALAEKSFETVKAPVEAAFASPVPSLARRVATPPPQSPISRTSSPAGSRKWARKVE